MSAVNLEWSIKRAVINLDDIEDEETKEALEKVKVLCMENKHAEALDMLPEISFEFDGNSLDSDPTEYLKEANYSFTLDKNSAKHLIQVGMQDDNLIVSITVVFEVDAVEEVDVDEFNEWLSDNGGWYAGNATGLWSYSEDDGGECRIV